MFPTYKTPVVESLTKYQFMVLKKLANSDIKIYCTMAGLPGEKSEDAINQDFNSILRLVELKLLCDSTEKHADLAKKYNVEGRDFAVVTLTHGGQWMFERTKWEKWLN